MSKMGKNEDFWAQNPLNTSILDNTNERKWFILCGFLANIEFQTQKVPKIAIFTIFRKIHLWDKNVPVEGQSVKEGKIPPSLCSDRTFFLHKKEDPSIADNYRPIVICNPITKVMEKSVQSTFLSKLQFFSDKRNFAYTAGASCQTALLKLANLVENSLAKKYKLYSFVNRCQRGF